MPKKLSTVIYDIDCDNPSKIANYNVGKLIESVGADLKKYCGKPVQGVVLATSGADKIIAKAKSDLVAKKLVHAQIKAGMSGDDLVFQVTDAKSPKYEQVHVLRAGYKKLRDEIKAQTGRVANFDPKDAIATDAADKVAKGIGAKDVKKGSNLPYGKITGSSPLILVAHGSEEDDLSGGGKIYGRKFAGKTAAELVKILTENPEESKRLSPEYSGTLYLNGCYTATPNQMGSYIENVWKLLKAKGYTKLKVKGNLGAASANDNGSMNVTTPEAEKAVDKLIKKFESDLGIKVADFEKELEKRSKGLKDAETKLKKLTDARAKIWKTTFQKDNDKDGFINAPLVKQIDQEITKTLNPAIKKLSTEIDTFTKAADKLKADCKKVPGNQVDDLVAQYGLDSY
jgi:hypothetical protein